MKNTFDEFINRLTTTKEMICNLEEMSIETFHIEVQKKLIGNNNEQKMQELWDNSQRVTCIWHNRGKNNKTGKRYWDNIKEFSKIEKHHITDSGLWSLKNIK